MAKKYYTVWKGKRPGIYESWDDCKAAISGSKGAEFKSFSSFAEAKKAFQGQYSDYKGKKTGGNGLSPAERSRLGEPDYNSIAVDAASSGNPGVMEYQGVDPQTGKRLFHQGPFQEGTNNIGEFLAIVHALAFLKQRNSTRAVYTDSRTAMAWVRKKTCNTKLAQTPANKPLFELIRRAEKWLRDTSYDTRILKWETKAWGEIPADFGRK